ncbi:MAG TPA: response regulator [Chloroflexia bacterium]|nr:response regulator [Chloroflexia bacterium]
MFNTLPPENNPSLLIVDDEPAIVEMLEMLLEDDFKVTGCSDPTQALQMAQQALPAVVMVDVMMPALNGIQILKNLRNVPSLSKIPVVLMTAGTNFNGLNETELKDLKAWVVKKPFDNYKLMDLLKELSAVA